MRRSRLMIAAVLLVSLLGGTLAFGAADEKPASGEKNAKKTKVGKKKEEKPADKKK